MTNASELRRQKAIDKREVDRAIKEFWALVNQREFDKRKARVMAIQTIYREVSNGKVKD